MPIAYPDINGVRHSYVSIEFGIDGTKVKGVKSINYKEETEVAQIYGTAALPIGRTRGRVKFSGDLEIYEEEWYKTFLPKLAKNGAIGFSEGAWPISVSYAEEAATENTVTDKLIGVRLLSPERSQTEGTDALVIKVTLDIMGITWGNKYVGLRTAR